MTRSRSLQGLLVLVILLQLMTCVFAQTTGGERLAAGRNVNMVAGTDWPNGDPYLQRQNEPSIAVSTRNPIHLLAGANDYRTVDIPGLPEGGETGDAWLGVFKSYDGGQSWISTLLPGYPQDTSPEGLASPLKQMGYQAGADPVVRAGTHGLFYYAGMAFDRGDFARSSIFVARFMDLNNYEGVITARDLVEAKGSLYDPLRYAGTGIVAQREAGVFLDKPWLEVDLPRTGAGFCTFEFDHPDGTVIEQTIPAGNLYLTYTEFRQDATGFYSDIWVTRSTDCGDSWSQPVQVSPPGTLNQGSTIAIDPRNGDVYVAWRQFPAGAAEPPLGGFGGEVGTCTSGGGFWKNEPNWPTSQLEIAGVVYSEAALRAFLKQSPKGDATIILLHQLIPVLLNIETGAADSDVYSPVKSALKWLEAHPPGSKPANPDRETGIELAALFEDYNIGIIGPGSCTMPMGVDVPVAPAGSDITPLSDGIYIARSADGGLTFQTPVAVGKAYPFDQPTTAGSFRTNAYPSIAVDTQGRVYVVWSSRGFSPEQPDPLAGDARIILSVFDPASGAWNGPAAIDLPGVMGHQIMPTLTFNAGKLTLVFYDFRADVSGAFDSFVIDEANLPIRHSVDLRAAQALPGTMPVFTDYTLVAADIAEPLKPSEQVSRYNFELSDSPETAESSLEPESYNHPNYPMFVQGTRPFLGDYIDVTPAVRYVPDPRNPGQWLFNSGGESPVSYAAWTDNRDVAAPLDGDWTAYTPPESAAKLDVSRIDGSPLDACEEGSTRGGMRNQNIYASRLTEGVYIVSPSTAKVTSEGLRSFVVLLQNQTTEDRWFRLTVLRQPEQGEASFTQFAFDPADPFCTQYGCPPYPLETLVVAIPPYSSAARTVYIRSALEYAAVEVDVQELDPNGNLLLNGLRGSLVLNGDPTNPRLMNPRLMNPRLMNDELHNAVILSVSVTNPRLMNPRLMNDVLTPRLMNADMVNPRLMNPDLQATDLLNPDLTNPRLMNQVPADFDDWENAVTDITWELENQGSTTSVYSFFAAAVLPEDYEDALMVQLLAYRVSTVPADNDCTLDVTYHQELLVNAVNPEFVTAEEMYAYMKQSPRLMNTQLENPRLMNTTFALAPGDRVYVTLRAIDFDPTDSIAIADAGDVVLAVVADAHDTTEGVVIEETGSAVFSGCLDGSTLSFADPALEAVVREALGVGPFFPIPCDGAAALTTLDASNRDIGDLGGIQSLRSLQTLNLEDNQIVGLGPLSSMSNLVSLEMGGNAISDLSPLAGLPNLTRLGLAGNQITDLTPLWRIPQLVSLTLDSNQIVDLEPLASITTLEELGLKNNLIDDLTPLAGLVGLRTLDVGGNLIADLTALQNLTQLEALDLSSNQVADLSALVANIGLGAGDELWLGGNPLEFADCGDLQVLSGRAVNVHHDVACRPAVPDPIVGNMHFVPATGPEGFAQGTPNDEPCRLADETQFTHILTRDILVMETEVSRRMWEELRTVQPTLPADPSSTARSPTLDHPVQNLTWLEAVLFANLLSIANGLKPAYYVEPWFETPIDATNYLMYYSYMNWDASGYRLPTEGEWEYFARAGLTGPFGLEEPSYSASTCSSCVPGTLPVLEGMAWFCANAGGHIHPVGELAPNAWGLKDLHGNVSELMSDWYKDYPAGTQTDYFSNPTEPPWTPMRIRRGRTSWYNPWGVRASTRDWTFSETRRNDGGFRLVRTMHIVPEMKFVPATPPEGFLQGSPPDEACRQPNEAQFRHVLTGDLAVTETEVTRLMWAELRSAQPTLPPDPSSEVFSPTMNHPVVQVTWYEALLFANLLSVARGQTPAYYVDSSLTTLLDPSNYITDNVFVNWDADGYRLPTEGEWEHFTRAGTAGPFSIDEPAFDDCSECSGGVLPRLETVGWFCANAGGWPRPAGQLAPNPWGLKDVHGNVWEWTWDRYGTYPTDPQTDYRGPSSGNTRVNRGGFSGYSPTYMRSAIRTAASPDSRSFIGFRLVRSRKPLVGEMRFVPATGPEGYVQGSPTTEPCRLSGGSFFGTETQFTHILTKSLLVMETEVTRQMWAELRQLYPELRADLSGGNGSVYNPATSEYPIDGVRRDEAALFANLLSMIYGLAPSYYVDPELTVRLDGTNYLGNEIYVDWDAEGYRLPTEGEWEYFARSGTEGPFSVEEPAYSTGTCGTCTPGVLPSLEGVAWFCANTIGRQPAGVKPANAWGLKDIHGNVGEWTWDLHADYPSGTQTDYRGPATGSEGVVRGGYANLWPWGLRSAARYRRQISNGRAGFRLVRGLNTLGPMHFVPATGPEGFVQGSPPDEPCRNPEDAFTHILTKDLLVMETEVTRQMWADLKAVQPSLPQDPSLVSFSPSPDHPVASITWYEGILFANLASTEMGLDPVYFIDAAMTAPVDAGNYLTDHVFADWNADGFRLPTDSEWEYFARAGTEWAFSVDEPEFSELRCTDCTPGALPHLETVAWFCANSGGTAHPVGQLQANPWGLRDVHGNAFEQVWDWFALPPTGIQTDYRGPDSGTTRIVRGGDAQFGPRSARSAWRVGRNPSDRGRTGFRLVRTLR